MLVIGHTRCPKIRIEDRVTGFSLRNEKKMVLLQNYIPKKKLAFERKVS